MCVQTDDSARMVPASLTTKPSKANEAAFDAAVAAVTAVSRGLLDSLVTTAPPKDREIEAAKAKERSRKRFAQAA